MFNTPKGLRLHIGIFGRTNVGKSSLLNALTRQNVSIISSVPGTTTDPVEKAMELLPIGPVLFIDTAGINDVSSLGGLRLDKTKKIIDRVDIALLVTEADVWGEFEENLFFQFVEKKIPVLVILNKTDILSMDEKIVKMLSSRKIPYVGLSCSKAGWDAASTVKNEIIKILPDELMQPVRIIADLIKSGDTVVLVVPVDKEAPKGRLIMPQQQAIRDILDAGAYAYVVNEKTLSETIKNLRTKPAMVVTDSQAFETVFKQTPLDIPVTSFSMLFARFKGDLEELVKGACEIDKLQNGDSVLIAEACTHHPIGDDIGRVKIPDWIRKKQAADIKFDIISGHDYPEDLSKYKLIIHCGACTLNRKEMLSRIMQCRLANVPITNYGIAIAHIFGNLKRALEPLIKKDDTEKS
ncbi:MAG: tRNA modification GTPase MnmE [Elusimicrobia bacterium ADurb.Bin231]|nr:MAG: tRNA modification GTPase MnmE [Elusimicrobia bacterium ADurb.Bin231]